MDKRKRTKQIITGIATNVFFLPPIYFVFIHKGTGTNWKIISLSFLPLFIVLGGFRFFWGPDIFAKSTWREEGFSSFSEWFKKSQTLNGKSFRFIIKYFFPVFIAITILAGIAIKISN